MTDIEELFEQAVEQAPPSRLSAAQVYASGRARWRRRRGAAAGSAVSAGVAVLLVGIVATTGGTPTARSTPSGVVMWAGAADNSHLYLVNNKCIEPHNESTPSPLPSGYTFPNAVIRDAATSSPAPSSPESPAANSSYPLMLAPSPMQLCDELLASRDGGRSWRSQGLLPGPLLGYGIKPLGPETLVMEAAGTGPGRRAWVSVDSGAHWSEALRSDQPLDIVPANGGLVFTNVFDEIVAVDPVRRQIQPLAHQPDLLLSYVENAPTRGGLWVSGLEPATRRPAVATSHDGGQSWTVAVLPGTESTTIAQTKATILPSVVSRDGRTAYATVWQRDQAHGVELTGGSLRVFRTADGGTSWRSVDPSAQSPAMSASWSWVTADGKHVVGRFIRYDSDARNYLVSNDGRSYVQATLPGLPDTASADGRMAYTSTAVYTSSDGWTWHQVWPGE